MRTEFDFINNNYKNQRTWMGNVMYTITKFFANILIKYRWLYYVLNYTWGLGMTIVGWLVYWFTRIFLCLYIDEHGKFGHCHYLMIGDNWGGLSLGTNLFIASRMGDECTYHTKCHETGHTFQNAIWGPFAIFLIYIPSVIRYWYQTIRSKHNKSNVKYDCFWAEESATDIGTKFILKGYWH